jgi:large subunit GTPase 1
VIPIDNLKDPLLPLTLLSERIPQSVFSQYYKIPIEEKTAHNARQLIKAYCEHKKMFSQGSGQYDITKSSRQMLKDYVNGNLLYCKLPPVYD